MLIVEGEDSRRGIADQPEQIDWRNTLDNRW